MKRALFLLGLLAVFGLVTTNTASAQTTPITSYRMAFYAPGATQPMQYSDTFPASAVTCNLVMSGSGSTVNPTIVVWDDPVNTGRACSIDRSAFLISLPIGNYEGTLRAINAAGESGESNRAAFSRANPPAAPINVQITKPPTP